MEQYQISYAAEMVSQKEIYQTVLIIRGWKQEGYKSDRNL